VTAGTTGVEIRPASDDNSVAAAYLSIESCCRIMEAAFYQRVDRGPGMLRPDRRGLVAATLFLALAAWGLPGAALADKDQRNIATPPENMAPPSAIQVPVVSGIEMAVERLEQSGRLAALPVDWSGIRSFYAGGGAALWVTPTSYSALGAQLLYQVPKAVAAGMPAAAEAQSALASLSPQLPPAVPADAEALMSALYTVSAYDATKQVGDKTASAAELLGALSAAKEQSRTLAAQFPTFHMFWRLYAALPAYEGYYEHGGWPTISGTEKIEPGDRGPRVRQVAERLLVTGELPALGSDPELYDPALEVAVAAFQRTHGLNDDGVIGRRTIEEMNVSAEQRLKMVLLNLDRMRAESPDMEDRFVFVNIPGTELRVIDHGVTTFHANAIVGRVERKTPLLKSEIFQVKLNPDWSVPSKIAAVDMLRHELDEPGYFASKNVRVFASDGKQVDPRTINWRDVKKSGYFPYRLKQDAGPENALGPMKLDFQNDYSVFIHGTSAPKLFAKQDRFFSSGCVRVDDPLGLATFLIQDDPSWNRARVDEVVRSGKTTYVKLVRPIPLHIVYMTAWVDEQGVANFRNDVYGNDPDIGIPGGLRSPTLIAEQQGKAATPDRRQGSNK
jgi:murein L,D-transpeptidase YcbB/YkuD